MATIEMAVAGWVLVRGFLFGRKKRSCPPRKVLLPAIAGKLRAPAAAGEEDRSIDEEEEIAVRVLLAADD